MAAGNGEQLDDLGDVYPCPECGKPMTTITRTPVHRGYERLRRCKACGHELETLETVVDDDPDGE